jgi:L-seryl-tRNA(Ser) seleniumtransferase
MDIYDKLGVRKVINAMGTVTAIGGSIMPAEAYEAMAEAGRSFVFLNELHQKAGHYIAELVGVEAAYISSGAAGGMVLTAAACLTGTDQEKIWALPHTQGWRNEIVVQRDPAPNYVHQAMRHTGAQLVEVGTPEEMTVADIEGGLSEKTAAVMLYLYKSGMTQPTVSEVSPIAQRAGVRIIVDAAAELPPRRNLTQPLEDGAQLLVLSGGKGIFGPQATGLVLGQKELIEACRLNSNPNSSIGRPMKVGKEDICALIAALELFMAQDEEAEMEEYRRRADYIVQELAGIERINARTLLADPRGRPVIPRLYIDLEEDFGLVGREVCQQMLEGEPPVVIGETDGVVRVDVMMLEEWELRAVARRLREVLSAGG